MICYAECEFFIPDVHSLKEKRSILKRMTTRAKQQYNASIAEVDHQDVWQRSCIAIVSVASSSEAAEREVERVISFLESNSGWERTSTMKQFL
jgi:uncharacterized protein YlxP (DUF503 family)